MVTTYVEVDKRHFALKILQYNIILEVLCCTKTNKLNSDLATLLERVRLPFKIFECKSNILILLWWFPCEKLENELIIVFISILT